MMRKISVCGRSRARINLVAGLALSLIASGLARAEPGPVITYLMNTPVPMLTFGLFRLQYALDKEVDGPGYTARARYDWDQNQILISVVGLRLPAEEVTKETCKNRLMALRQRFGISIETGKPFEAIGSSLIELYFTNDGFVKKNEPDDIGGKLDQIVYLDITLLAEGSKAPPVSCKAPMLGTEVLFPG